MNKKIYIIRHGETEYNKLKMMQGRSIDLSLNETGKNQSNSFFDFYKNIQFDLLISSELKRSQESIEKLIRSAEKATWPEIDLIERSTKISKAFGKYQKLLIARENRLLNNEYELKLVSGNNK